ncbi:MULTISPECIES: hypothetical protein [unclassified Clostridium]|uniref:hypothetical protein n=1 Tax=unclassified Clostridium TaxID=2614128 RepID=UPI000297D84F|nr:MULTISPECIES: hypothetical protein [unclassified Clostridium]EKQ51191.1 MAG: hypothetical protein A370_05060 [Clostridium sp. Maddingley MBC34-26]
MKISKKEKTMLCVLGSIIVGFLYYQFIYLPQVDQLQQKIREENELKQKYDTVKSTIKSMEDKKSDVKILNAKINDEAAPFYPTIDQEKIITEIDKLLQNSGLKGGVTFQPIASNSVENSKKEVKSLAESSLQSIVDQYNSASGDTEKAQQSNDKTSNNSANNQVTNGNSATASNNSNQSNNKDAKDTKKNTVQYVKCEVKIQGTYGALDKFLNAIDQNQNESGRKIVVNSINLTSDSSDSIKGTIALEFYSIPKITDELKSYLNWDINKSYGKSVPFGGGTVSNQSPVTGTNTAASTKQSEETSDFIASVKPIASDLPTIMIGKAKDDLRTTYAYADSNSVQNVEMILTQDGDKYYYKYKTSKGSFPANYDGLGAEFVPTSKNIVLDVLSRSRIDANDNSSMKLKIVNKTDRHLDVNISGDDSNNPRVTVEGDLNNISVNNK